MSSRNRGQEGAAAVEFALVSVLLLTLVFSIIQYGFYFYESQSAAAGSREAVRLAVVGIPDCNLYTAGVKAKVTGLSSGYQYQLSYPNGRTVGEKVSVVIVFTPTKLGFPFVPFISGKSSQTGFARLERNEASWPDCSGTVTP